MREFAIFLTFDIDQDFLPGSADYDNRSSVQFEGYKQGLPFIMDVLDGRPFSVFVRADYQIKTLMGEYDALISNNPDLHADMIAANGELNWHIHLYKQAEGAWVQIRDEKEAVERFAQDLEAVRQCAGINSKIVRVGECYMTNAIMKCMHDGGVRIDSTALPGRQRQDRDKYFDWEITQNDFYFPSRTDYRRGGPDSYENLMEVPMTTIPMKTAYDTQPYRRYVNLAFHPDILFQNIADYIDKHDSLITMTHPCEILPIGKHGLISYEKEVFQSNLARLTQVVVERGKVPVFKKIGDLLS